jgi:hypothetical protein
VSAGLKPSRLSHSQLTIPMVRRVSNGSSDECEESGNGELHFGGLGCKTPREQSKERVREAKVGRRRDVKQKYRAKEGLS